MVAHGACCREHRRFLLFWAAVFAATSSFMTFVTYAHGPDPHDYFGCSVPFAMWLGCLLVASLSCYTTDYIRSVAQPCPIQVCSRSLFVDTINESTTQTHRYVDDRSEGGDDLLAVSKDREKYIFDPKRGYFVEQRQHHGEIHVAEMP